MTRGYRFLKVFAALVAGVGAMCPPAAADEGPSLDTERLQRQIDEAEANGGGVVVIPSGRHLAAFGSDPSI